MAPEVIKKAAYDFKVIILASQTSFLGGHLVTGCNPLLPDFQAPPLPRGVDPGPLQGHHYEGAPLPESSCLLQQGHRVPAVTAAEEAEGP